MTGYRVPVGLWSDRAAFILGGGPSLKGFDCDRLRGRGGVIAVNDAGLELAPWADCLYFADGMSRWGGWNLHRLGDFRGEVLLTRSQMPERHGIRRIGCDPKRALSDDPTVLAGHCGGANAINLAHLLGAPVIVLLGFDLVGGNWHDNHRLPRPRGQLAEKILPSLERMAAALAATPTLMLNTNPESALRAFPFVEIEELLAMDDLTKIERETYETVWTAEEYRRFSPGAVECERAFRVCGMEEGQSLIDAGAGPGRATAWFAEQGLDVLAIDIADNALETKVPFKRACLWELPKSVKPADHVFCCDVLEHIPPERPDLVLEGLAARTKATGYLRIASRPDVMGPKLVDRPLHLIVEGPDWWRARLLRHWSQVSLVEMTGRDVVYLVRP